MATVRHVLALALCAVALIGSVGASAAADRRTLALERSAFTAGAPAVPASASFSSSADSSARGRLGLGELSAALSFAVPLALTLLARKAVLPRAQHAGKAPTTRQLATGSCECRFCRGQCAGCACCEHTHLPGRHCAC